MNKPNKKKSTRNPDWVDMEDVYKSYILEKFLYKNTWLVLDHAKDYETIEKEMLKVSKKGGSFRVIATRIDDGSLHVIYKSFFQ